MAGLPGWSIDEPVTANDLTLLPRGARWETSNPNTIHGELIRNRTTGGKRYRYRLYRDQLIEYGFRFPQEENDDFAAIWDATDDGALPFYFVPDSSDMTGVIYGWLEDENYAPQNIGQAARGSDGDMQLWFDWVLRIGTEVADVEIEP